MKAMKKIFGVLALLSCIATATFAADPAPPQDNKVTVLEKYQPVKENAVMQLEIVSVSYQVADMSTDVVNLPLADDISFTAIVAIEKTYAEVPARSIAKNSYYHLKRTGKSNTNKLTSREGTGQLIFYKILKPGIQTRPPVLLT